MKTKFFIIMLFGVISIGSIFAQTKNTEKKPLIVYFSKTGNTEMIANYIKENTGADVFKVEPIKAYPAEYKQATDVAKVEQKNNARPKFVGNIDNIDDYDVIFLGFPNWWGTMPMILFTFLESYDFTDKTIIPFCTYGGSRMGHSEADIKKLCPKSKITKGLAINSNDVKSAQKKVEDWLKKIK